MSSPGQLKQTPEPTRIVCVWSSLGQLKQIPEHMRIVCVWSSLVQLTKPPEPTRITCVLPSLGYRTINSLRNCFHLVFRRYDMETRKHLICVQKKTARNAGIGAWNHINRSISHAVLYHSEQMHMPLVIQIRTSTKYKVIFHWTGRQPRWQSMAE